MWQGLKLWKNSWTTIWIVLVIYIYIYYISYFSHAQIQWATLLHFDIPVKKYIYSSQNYECIVPWLLSLWITAAVQNGRDKLTETAVEKNLFTNFPNLEAHSCSVYLGMQTPNINLSWGVQSLSPCVVQHDNNNTRTYCFVFECGNVVVFFLVYKLQTWNRHSSVTNGGITRALSVFVYYADTSLLEMSRKQKPLRNVNTHQSPLQS